jgi:hypothetical protein
MSLSNILHSIKNGNPLTDEMIDEMNQMDIAKLIEIIKAYNGVVNFLRDILVNSF